MENIDTRYDFDGSHAAPMFLTGEGVNSLLVARQGELAQEFEALAHEQLDDTLGYELAEYVATSIKNRMAHREGLNSHSYISRQHKYVPNIFIPGYSPFKVIGADMAARNGTGTPLQCHLARRSLGMATVEIANLTTIGEARTNLLEPMQEGIQELAGEDVDFGIDSAYRFSFLGTNVHLRSGEKASLMRVGYKSKYKDFKNGTILKGRNTANIDVRDASTYDPELIRLFQELHKQRQPLTDIPEFTRIVRNLITGNLDPKTAVARNYTTYEVDQKAIDRLAAKQKRREDASSRRSKATLTQVPVDDIPFPVGDPRRRAQEMYGRGRNDDETITSSTLDINQ